jgi:two-component system phosphate regulon response regulator PhoB
MKLRPLVLLAEPNAVLALVMRSALSADGFDVDAAGEGRDVVRAAVSRASDVAVVNDRLPDMRGVSLRRALAQSEQASMLPLIIYRPVSQAGAPSRFVLNADRRTSEPLPLARLCQCVRALSRPAAAQTFHSELQCGTVRVDTEAHRVYVDSHRVELTALEFRLLVMLLSAGGRVLSRDRLLADVWGVRRQDDTRTVATNIKRLRQKLGRAAGLIQTIRHVGYRLDDLPDGAASRLHLGASEPPPSPASIGG